MPLLWLSVFFLAGVLLASVIHLSQAGWLALCLVAALLGFLELRRPALSGFKRSRGRYAPIPLGFLLAALLLGAARFQGSLPSLDPGHLAYYNNNSEVRFTAVVIEPPRRLENSVQLRLRAEHLIAENDNLVDRQLSGQLLAVLPLSAQYEYGDRLLLRAHLQTPPENAFFSYRAYLEHQQVYTYTAYPQVRLLGRTAASPVYQRIYALRSLAYRVLNSLYPPAEASLLSGILLGLEDDIPPSLEKAFRDTGTAHIIAISGFNIAILAALFSLAASRIFRNRWVSLLATLLGVAFYTLLVGASPSVVRAAVMGCVSLLGVHIGRRNSGVNALVFTAALMCAFSPGLLWQASFQLSFTATLGLVWFGVPADQFLRHWLSLRVPVTAVNRLAGPINEYILLTLAAQLTTLPVVLYHFQRLSLSSLLANPLILPVQPLIMVLGGLSVLAGMLLQPLGQFLSYLAWPFLEYTIRAVQALANLSWGSLVVGRVSLLWIAIYYLGLLLLVRSLGSLKRLRSHLRPALVLAAFGFASLFVWKGFYNAPNGYLTLYVIPNPPNPSLLLQSPSGRYLFIQNGAPTLELSAQLSKRLPPFHQKIDGWLLPGTQADVLKDLPELLGRFPPNWILWNDALGGTRSGERLVASSQAAVIPLLGLQPGQSIDLGGGAALQVLETPNQNPLLGLSFGDFRALFVSSASPAELMHGLPPPWSTSGAVLVLSDIDFNSAPPSHWLALQPSLVVASYGAPGVPSNWLPLDRHGAAELRTDGRHIWVSADK